MRQEKALVKKTRLLVQIKAVVKGVVLSIRLRVMAESAAVKGSDGSVAGGGTTGSDDTSAPKGNGKVAFVTGINGQVSCGDARTSR